MKLPRRFSFLFLLVLLGGLLGYFLSTRSFNYPEESPAESGPVPADAPAQVTFDFPGLSPQGPEETGLSYPAGALKGELVVHFDSQSEYRRYLAALRQAGVDVLGQIDELMAVRIPESALRKVNFGAYRARGSSSYRVERPAPPVDVDPQALASLRAYGTTAREITTGGPGAGDGSGLIVGILDSGIQAHPQFDDVYIVHIDLAGGGVAGPGAAHGTSVASIITGTEGIAPQAELFVVRVLDDKGLGNSYHVAEGIVQAVDLGVKVINMSLGLYQDTPLLRQAVRYADDRGVILVAAAGNDGFNRMPYPAAYEQVLAVTAVDAQGRQAVFPNQSHEIDFAAPGVGVRAAKEDEGTMLFSGTSAAAPFVSGTLAALMTGEEALSPREAVKLMERMLNDAGAPGPDPVYGAGIVDWVRLRERAQPGILDIALAGIHLDPETKPGTTMPIEVTVQNRGTKWFNRADLEVLIGEADPVRFTIGTLGPGQTTTRKVYTQIPSLDSDAALSLAARVLPEDLNEDVRLENNLKSVQFRLP